MFTLAKFSQLSPPRLAHTHTSTAKSPIRGRGARQELAAEDTLSNAICISKLVEGYSYRLCSPVFLYMFGYCYFHPLPFASRPCPCQATPLCRPSTSFFKLLFISSLPVNNAMIIQSSRVDRFRVTQISVVTSMDHPCRATRC